MIWAHQQSPLKLPFRVPWVPLLPAASVMLNVELMVNLNALTWARFAIWMTFGNVYLALYNSYILRNRWTEPNILFFNFR